MSYRDLQMSLLDLHVRKRRNAKPKAAKKAKAEDQALHLARVAHGATQALLAAHKAARPQDHFEDYAPPAPPDGVQRQQGIDEALAADQRWRDVNRRIATQQHRALAGHRARADEQRALLEGQQAAFEEFRRQRDFNGHDFDEVARIRGSYAGNYAETLRGIRPGRRP